MSKAKVSHGCDDMCGGDYVRIDLPNGKVVLVWNEAVDPADGDSVIELFASDDDYDNNVHAPAVGSGGYFNF